MSAMFICISLSKLMELVRRGDVTDEERAEAEKQREALVALVRIVAVPAIRRAVDATFCAGRDELSCT